jgi:hypothetical protein
MDNPGKVAIFIEGWEGILKDFEEKAPLEEAIPSEDWIKKAITSKRVAVEPRKHKNHPTQTHVNSGCDAFTSDGLIKMGWEWPGYERAASELAMSKSKLEKRIQDGYACKPDRWNNHAMFDPSSYWHLKGL